MESKNVHKKSQNMVIGDSMLNNVENNVLLSLNTTKCNNSTSSDQYTTNQITRPSKFELTFWRRNYFFNFSTLCI